MTITRDREGRSARGRGRGGGRERLVTQRSQSTPDQSYGSARQDIAQEASTPPHQRAQSTTPTQPHQREQSITSTQPHQREQSTTPSLPEDVIRGLSDQSVDDLGGEPPASGGICMNRSIADETESTHVDKRKPIRVERTGEKKLKRFTPSITRDVMQKVMIRMPNCATHWSEYDREMKDVLFAEFMAKYKFADPADEAIARDVWENLCQDRYSDNLNHLMKKGLKDNNTDNIEETKGKPPVGMRKEIWDEYVNYWTSDTFLRRSEADKKNRSSIPEASVHTGGSRSFADTKRVMEKELQHEVVFRDVLKKAHMDKSGNFVNDLWQHFDKTLEAGMNRKYGEDPANHPRFDPEVWIEAAGPNNKGRVRGLGSGLTLSVGSCGSDAATHGCSFAQRESDPVQEGHNERLLRIEQSLQEVQQNTASERQKIEQTLQNFQASMQQSIEATLQQVRDAIGGQQGSRTRHTQGHHPSSSREPDDDQALDNDFNPQAP